LIRRQVVLGRFLVQLQQVDRLRCFDPVVDHAKAAAFSLALDLPSDLSEAAGSRDDDALLGAENERELECSIGLVSQEFMDSPCEDRCFDELHGVYANGA